MLTKWLSTRLIKVEIPLLAFRQSKDEGLTLETSAFQIFHGGNSTFINLLDKSTFSWYGIMADFDCSANMHA